MGSARATSSLSLRAFLRDFSPAFSGMFIMRGGRGGEGGEVETSVGIHPDPGCFWESNHYHRGKFEVLQGASTPAGVVFFPRRVATSRGADRVGER